MKRTLIVISTCALMAIAMAQNGRIELFAGLTGQGKGKAVWKTRDKVRQMQAEFSVEGENLEADTDYIVTIGANTWTVTTDGFGDFDFDQRYIGANRPSIGLGNAVTVKDAGNAVVLSGVFVRRR